MSKRLIYLERRKRLEVKNLNQKRVCDISPDRKKVQIRKGDCLTEITVNKDGTLNISHRIYSIK